MVFYGVDPVDAPGDFTRSIDRALRINDATQLHGALVGFDTDFEGLEKIISGKQRFYLGRDDRIVNVLARAFVSGCRGAGRHKGSHQHKNHKIANNDIRPFHCDFSFLSVCGERTGYKSCSAQKFMDSPKSFKNRNQPFSERRSFPAWVETAIRIFAPE
jgi:hypothetical protein